MGERTPAHADVQERARRVVRDLGLTPDEERFVTDSAAGVWDLAVRLFYEDSAAKGLRPIVIPALFAELLIDSASYADDARHCHELGNS